ncbi:MAG: VCBS repeat-containing protein [Phycisphaeraceae bacterium]|nr:VCBS repeat-containing protein [Phycisphaerales bacterium]MCB9842787.1 VCBS repeat-containing protein [Phycisphaeraceae bacterium]
MSQRYGLAAVIGVISFGSFAGAQQFVEQSTTRFPQPDPNDYTNQMTIGDIDGDDDLDIIFANGGNFSSAGTPQRVRIMINDGAGVFTEESATRIASHTGNYRAVELGDIDGDDDLDMILSSDFNRQPRLFVNNGSGVFTDATVAQMPAITLSATRAQFADIDNDGDLDIYINNGGATNRFGSGQNQIFVNNGAGFFTNETATRHPAALQSEPMDVIFGDIDGDFDLDVRTGSTGTNQSRMLRNDGSGVFAVTGFPNDSNAYSYDFGDIDNDGDLDALGANANPSGNNSELLAVNNGAGIFSNNSTQISPNPSVDDNDSKFFDYDMDGDLDLIVARLGGSAERIYNNDGAGNFTEVTGLITSISDSTLDIMVADLNNDGRPDIVTAQGESGAFRNRLYINTTGPVDNLPPTINRTEQVVPSLLAGSAALEFVVRTDIRDEITSDRGAFLSSVVLNVSVNGAPATQTPMRWSGHQVYRGVISLVDPPCGALVEYSVTATDMAGNVANGPTLSFNVTGVLPAGDIDMSGAVDVDDLNAVLSAFGTSVGIGSPVDVANNDGVIDVDDLNVVLANWGSTCS